MSYPNTGQHSKFKKLNFESLRIPEYYQTRGIPTTPPSFNILAGEKQAYPTSSLALAQRNLEGVYDSAKELKISPDVVLPWELDKGCKLFSTASEKRDFNIQYLLDLTGLKINKEGLIESQTDNSYLQRYYSGKAEAIKNDSRFQPLMTAASDKLIIALLDRALFDKESAFKKGLKDFISGDMRHEETEFLWWMPENLRYPKLFQAPDPKTNPKLYDEYTKAKKTLINEKPNILYGIVSKEETTALRKKVFLDRLVSTPPKTDEEFYLWYKYIILRRDIPFDVLDYIDLNPNIPTPPPLPPARFPGNGQVAQNIAQPIPPINPNPSIPTIPSANQPTIPNPIPPTNPTPNQPTIPLVQVKKEPAASSFEIKVNDLMTLDDATLINQYYDLYDNNGNYTFHLSALTRKFNGVIPPRPTPAATTAPTQTNPIPPPYTATSVPVATSTSTPTAIPTATTSTPSPVSETVRIDKLNDEDLMNEYQAAKTAGKNVSIYENTFVSRQRRVPSRNGVANQGKPVSSPPISNPPPSSTSTSSSSSSSNSNSTSIPIPIPKIDPEEKERQEKKILQQEKERSEIIKMLIEEKRSRVAEQKQAAEENLAKQNQANPNPSSNISNSYTPEQEAEIKKREIKQKEDQETERQQNIKTQEEAKKKQEELLKSKQAFENAKIAKEKLEKEIEEEEIKLNKRKTEEFAKLEVEEKKREQAELRASLSKAKEDRDAQAAKTKVNIENKAPAREAGYKLNPHTRPQYIAAIKEAERLHTNKMIQLRNKHRQEKDKGVTPEIKKAMKITEENEKKSHEANLKVIRATWNVPEVNK